MVSFLGACHVLQTAVNHTAQLILFLTRDEISGCQDIIDQYAGKVCTLTNSAHYPKQLVKAPEGTHKQIIQCKCNHRLYCKACERIGDSDNSGLAKR